MSNIARFQFGDAGFGLVKGASFRGRVPDVRVIRQGVQLAMYTGRGMLSLTLAGGAILSDADAYWVEIENFLTKGNIFAVGVVDAAPEIRPGDEVVFIEVEGGLQVQKRREVSPFSRYRGYLSHLKGQDPDALLEAIRRR